MARPEANSTPTQPSSHLHVQSESDPQLINDQVYNSQVVQPQQNQQRSPPDSVQYEQLPTQNPQTIPVEYMQHVPQNNPIHVTFPGQYMQTNSPYVAQPTQYPVQPMPSNYHCQANTQPFTQPVQFVPVHYETQFNAQLFHQVPVQQPNNAPVIMVQPPPYFRPAGTVAWTTGLFDCIEDPMNALTTFVVPCLTFGQIAEIVDSGHTSCATSGILYSALACLIGLPCLLSCTYRTKLRSRYDLLESPAPDWITHFLCEYCALCQEYRELQNRGIDPSIGWHGNVLRNQNVQQCQVAMVPPTNQNMMG